MSTAAGERVFARRATGILAEAKTTDAFYYNVMWSSVALTFTFFWILYPFYYLGANAFLSILLASALGLPGAFLYALLAHVMPRTGGDYVFNSRTLHPAIGFMANFSYCFWLSIVYGVYTTYIAAYGIGAFSRMIAGFTGRAGWLDFGDWFSTDWGLFITGTTVMVLSAVLFIFGGTRPFFRFQAFCFATYILSFLIVIFVGLFQDHAGFLSNFNDYAGRLGADNATKALDASATKGGFAASDFSLGASVKAVSVFWFIFGFTYASNYFAGEIRAAKRAHVYSIPGAAILGTLILLGITAAYVRFSTYDFNGKLGFADPAAYGFAGGAPAYPEISAIGSGNPFLGSLIIIGFTLGLLIWLPQTMLLISRSMFAWSFDRLMPERLSYIHERTRAPVFVLIIITVLGIASTAVYAFTTWFTTISVLLGLSLTLIVTAVSGIVLPFRRADLFEKSAFNQRLAGIPVLTIVGVVSLVGFAAAITILLTDPGSGTSLQDNPGKLELALLVYAAAAIIYFVSSAFRRRQGIDVRLAYRDVPPE
ncbi:MAG: APC family permease [Actinomycetota bacterium]|nr:APC family permease [Actinomycetota bacterium]